MSPASQLAVLDPADADALRRIAELLGFDIEDDVLPPPVASVIETAAVFATARGMSEVDPFPARLRAACAALGLDARAILRRHYRWQLAAARHFVTADQAAA